MADAGYIGRFAPSPSGALHFGSLVTALGSFLQARQQQGRWRVRIEDIDPPRESPAASQMILRQLAHYGLHWDGDVLYQSRRAEAYHEALHQLARQGLSYRCTCSRERIRGLGGVYDGHCRPPLFGSLLTTPADKPAALRLVQRYPVYQFTDQLHGLVTVNRALAQEDFIIHRRDGLFAYNLAVVVDDHEQQISEVVRGADLLLPSARQLSLYQAFGWQAPVFCHLPLVRDARGNKLSKQNHAPPLPEGDPRPLLAQALQFLQQPTFGWQDLSLDQLLAHAIAHWQPACLRQAAVDD